MTRAIQRIALAFIGGVILSLNGNALSGLRVLILEDEFLIAMEAEHICRDHGAAGVTMLRNVAEAEELDGAFDVAILDVMVGGFSSLDFARRLRTEQRPFVFASGYGHGDGVFAGFPDVPVVAKPYSVSALIGALTQAVANRDAG